MGMPQIPDGTNRPNLEELVIDLFEAIALDQMAISHVLNAEGEKLQSVVASFKNQNLSVSDLNTIHNNTHQTISDLIVKEWLLLSKFNNVRDLSNSILENTNLETTCNNDNTSTNNCNYNNNYNNYNKYNNNNSCN